MHHIKQGDEWKEVQTCMSAPLFAHRVAERGWREDEKERPEKGAEKETCRNQGAERGRRETHRKQQRKRRDEESQNTPDRNFQRKEKHLLVGVGVGHLLFSTLRALLLPPFSSSPPQKGNLLPKKKTRHSRFMIMT
mmetsp:Transcript_21047/g.54391  ORF Transcript_21047/g.54391 Transcript_21047/m.54391 type:complete len:136 (+) Transcript_21047:4613-5020(+)